MLFLFLDDIYILVYIVVTELVLVQVAFRRVQKHKIVFSPLFTWNECTIHLQLVHTRFVGFELGIYSQYQLENVIVAKQIHRQRNVCVSSVLSTWLIDDVGIVSPLESGQVAFRVLSGANDMKYVYHSTKLLVRLESLLNAVILSLIDRWNVFTQFQQFTWIICPCMMTAMRSTWTKQKWNVYKRKHESTWANE